MATIQSIMASEHRVHPNSMQLFWEGTKDGKGGHWFFSPVVGKTKLPKHVTKAEYEEAISVVLANPTWYQPDKGNNLIHTFRGVHNGILYEMQVNTAVRSGKMGHIIHHYPVSGKDVMFLTHDGRLIAADDLRGVDWRDWHELEK